MARAPADRYIVTLGVLVCIEPSPFASEPSRSLTVLTAAAGGFRISVNGESRGAVCDVIVIPPGTRYSIADSTAEILRFLVEPGGNVGRRLRYALKSDPKRGSTAMIDVGRRLVEHPQVSAMRRGTWHTTVRTMFARIDPPNAPRSEDVDLLQRLAAAVEHELHGPIATPTLTARLGVPPERLGQTLSRQIGLPIRPFVQWYRILHYARLVALGNSPDWSARATGFGSWAKLTQFAQRTFGLEAVDLAAVDRWTATEDVLV